MKKLALKWKFFLVFSYAQLILYGVVFLIITFLIFDSRFNTSPNFNRYFWILLGFFAICFNNLTNIRAVYKYFPDQVLTSAIRITINILGVINIILLIGLIILFIFGLGEEIKVHEEQGNNLLNITLVICSLLLFITGLYNIILQFQMNKYLLRKNKDKLNSLINLIGKE